MAPSESTSAHTVVAHAKKEQQAGAVPEPLSRSQAYAQFNCCVLDFFWCWWGFVGFFGTCFAAKLNVWFQEVYLLS